MNTVSKWGDEDIEKLVKGITSDLKQNIHKEDGKSLDTLRTICGRCECYCRNLTPCQKLSRFLKLMHNNVTDYQIGLSIMNNYSSLAFEKHCQKALETMVSWSLHDTNSESKYHFLDQLWTYQGLKNLKPDVLEVLIFKESKYIEEDIFQMFERVYSLGEDPDNLWKEDRFERLVVWSCRSGKIFYSVTSVLNSWALRVVNSTDQYISSLNIINIFICKVKQTCANSKLDFVSLYPREYHSLVSLLDIEQELPLKQLANETLLSVNELIIESLKNKPVQTVCILTHFPEWAKLVSGIITENVVFKI